MTLNGPQFPDVLGVREPVRPGATVHKAGLSVEQQVQALTQGALSIPGPGVTDGSVPVADTASRGRAKWLAAGLVTPVAWTTFPYAAGVSDFGSGFGPPKYMKDATGTVFSRGLVQCSVTSAGTSTIGTMPAGCRPGVEFRFPMQVNGVTKDANITAGGVITVAHAATDWVSVTFSYKAEQ